MTLSIQTMLDIHYLIFDGKRTILETVGYFHFGYISRGVKL